MPRSPFQCSKDAPECSDPIRMFRDRMAREGRVEELDRKIGEYRAAGNTERKAVYAAMKDMGYTSKKDETKLHIAFKGAAMRAQRRVKQAECQKRWREKQKALAEGSSDPQS